MSDSRRIVLIHTAGPYPGLRQILGIIGAEQLGNVPDILPAYPGPPMALWPDRRLAKALRLRSTERMVLYREQEVESAAEAA